MAERRMFAKSIIGSARFLRMPPSSRLLYYDLGMYADDDGVVEAFTVMRQTNATEDDLRVLVAKGFVKILNEDLVAVITDWNVNNLIRSDRYKPSIYKDLLVGIPNDNQRYTSGNPSIGKGRLGKVSLGNDNNMPSTEEDDDFMETVREIVFYLNETIGTQYKPTSGYIKKLIHARLEDKFTVDDFKTVIWKKAKEWKGTKFEQYLRPQTLFGTKFESYLNQSGEVRGGDKPYGAEEVEGFYQMMEEWANDE